MSVGDPSFPFRFELDVAPTCAPADRVLENFVRQQIEGLLDIVVLTSNGKPVRVDGFVWMKDAYGQGGSLSPLPLDPSGSNPRG
jgi:hypothetical protein